MRRERAIAFAAAALLGAALRVAALPLSGSTDVPYFRVWARVAASEGVAGIYGTGGRFPERRLLESEGVRTKVDYPPIALYELGIAARVADAVAGAPASDRALTYAIKGLVIAAEACLALLILTSVSRASTPDVARRGMLRSWLDPGAILIGSAFGYLEPLYLLPAMAALFAAAQGHAARAGVLLALALLTKPLAVLFAPAIAAGLWRSPRGSNHRGVMIAFAAAFVVGTAAVAPIALHGGLPNMLWSVGSQWRDPLLTGNAANVWWLAGEIVDPPLEPARIVGAVAAIGAIGWAVSRIPGTDAGWLAAGAAFAVHAYAVLAVSVHENHLFGAIPPLVVAAALRPRFRGVLAVVSIVCAANLALTAEAVTTPGASAAGALVACANCGALAWHAAVMRDPGPPVAAAC